MRHIVVEWFKRSAPSLIAKKVSMYRRRTLAALLLSAATIGLGIGVGTVSAASPQELVDAPYKAMGLTNAVNTLVVKGTMHTWDPGESQDAYKPETGDFGVSTFTESADLGRGLYRVDWVRPKPNGGMRNYTEVFSNEIGGKMGGYVTGVDINNGTPQGRSRMCVGNGCCGAWVTASTLIPMPTTRPTAAA
jgi:hypothetical protein